ncbi:MAG: hypothetical protein LBU98_00020, partial [Alistipes sp.]|nr:hypothetical protein [Alistipes sp.]
MKRTVTMIIAAAALAFAACGSGASGSVAIEHDASSRQVAYAARRLADALRESGYTLVDALTPQPGEADTRITLAVDTSGGLVAEAFSIEPVGGRITITGGDDR